MFDDAALRERLHTMIAAIETPAVPTGTISMHASRPEASFPPGKEGRITRVAIAASIAFALSLAVAPLVAPSVVETMRARIARLMLWSPPPPAPKSIDAAMVSRVVSLQAAQTLVDFLIVPPSGLPRDVVATKIFATPTAVYSEAERAWRLGAPSLNFLYRRLNGRQFSLQVAAYDPREGAPPRYMYNADEIGPDGLPKRYENFAWRNGGQRTSAIADTGLSAEEIEAIRVAMHGISLRPATTRAELMGGSIVKKYAVP
jgi:hypothetical protein